MLAGGQEGLEAAIKASLDSLGCVPESFNGIDFGAFAKKPQTTTVAPAKSALDNWSQPHSAMMEAHSTTIPFTTFLATLYSG